MNDPVAREKSAFWLLLCVIGFIEVMAFIAAAGVGHARWQVHVVESVLYIVGDRIGWLCNLETINLFKIQIHQGASKQ